MVEKNLNFKNFAPRIGVQIEEGIPRSFLRSHFLGTNKTFQYNTFRFPPAFFIKFTRIRWNSQITVEFHLRNPENPPVRPLLKLLIKITDFPLPNIPVADGKSLLRHREKPWARKLKRRSVFFFAAFSSGPWWRTRVLLDFPSKSCYSSVCYQEPPSCGLVLIIDTYKKLNKMG